MASAPPVATATELSIDDCNGSHADAFNAALLAFLAR